jgi:hypothetical protein
MAAYFSWKVNDALIIALHLFGAPHKNMKNSIYGI